MSLSFTVRPCAPRPSSWFGALLALAMPGALASVSAAQEVLPFPPDPSGSIAGRTMQE